MKTINVDVIETKIYGFALDINKNTPNSKIDDAIFDDMEQIINDMDEYPKDFEPDYIERTYITRTNGICPKCNSKKLKYKEPKLEGNFSNMGKDLNLEWECEDCHTTGIEQYTFIQHL